MAVILYRSPVTWSGRRKSRLNLIRFAGLFLELPGEYRRVEPVQAQVRVGGLSAKRVEQLLPARIVVHKDVSFFPFIQGEHVEFECHRCIPRWCRWTSDSPVHGSCR